jgi:Spx/MgsR family transcriptional regulator
MIKMYAIANCDTVKKARTFLDNKKVIYTFVDFKKTPPSEEEINRWAEFFGELPANKKGTTYKKFKDEFEALNKKNQIMFLIEHSSMIKRPIIEKNNKVLAIGFNEKEYLEWIK